MIFSYNKCCVCPRDIEVYLPAVFLCLAAALPHHSIRTNTNKSKIYTKTLMKNPKNYNPKIYISHITAFQYNSKISNSELDTSSLYNINILSINLPARSQRSQRLDYHVLNDGNDEGTILEDRIFKKPLLISQSDSNNTISPDDFANQSNLTTSIQTPE